MKSWDDVLWSCDEELRTLTLKLKVRRLRFPCPGALVRMKKGNIHFFRVQTLENVDNMKFMVPNTGCLLLVLCVRSPVNIHERSPKDPIELIVLSSSGVILTTRVQSAAYIISYVEEI